MPEQEEAKQPEVNEYSSLRKLVTAGLFTGMLPGVTTSEFSEKPTTKNKADDPSKESSNNQDSRAKRNKEARRDVMYESIMVYESEKQVAKCDISREVAEGSAAAFKHLQTRIVGKKPSKLRIE